MPQPGSSFSPHFWQVLGLGAGASAAFVAGASAGFGAGAAAGAAEAASDERACLASRSAPS